MTNPTDDRSPLARATEWASSVTAIAFQMVVPLLIGVWIDRRLGTWAIFAAMGGAIGLTAGIWSLLRMTEPLRRGRDKTRNHREPPP